MWHLCLFLRSLSSLIRQYSHISVWGIRWPFCAYSLPIKNVTTVAAPVSFGSWVAGGLTCSKSAAVAEPKSHQVLATVFSGCRGGPWAASRPLCVTHNPLRSAPSLLGHHESSTLVVYCCCVWIDSESLKKLLNIIVWYHCRLKN